MCCFVAWQFQHPDRSPRRHGGGTEREVGGGPIMYETFSPWKGVEVGDVGNE